MTIETHEPQLIAGDMQALFKQKMPVLRIAQKAWKKLSIHERLQCFKRMREILSSKSKVYAAILSEENSKTLLESLTQEIIPTLDALVYLEKNAQDVLKTRAIKLQTRQFYFKGKENFMQYKPYGVIGILGTWNYPFYLCLTQVLFALVAGNAVVLKTSELSPKIAEAMQELLMASGFPQDLIWVFASDAKGGEALCQAACDKYILTGSRQTGKAVLKTIANNLKPAVMELSGCDPYVILSDADWKLATRSLVWAAFQYSGQTCVAPRRVFVLKKDKERFLSTLKAEWESSKDFISHQGKLRTEGLVQKEIANLKTLVAKGAKLELGEVYSDKSPGIFPPAVYSGLGVVDLNCDFMCPLIFIVDADSEEDLLKSVEDSSFALGASLWTQSRARAQGWTQRLNGGQCWVNDGFFSVALGEVAFGGYGSSGFGKTRGPEGLLEMVQHQFVSYDWRQKRMLRHLPPYDGNSFEILNTIQQFLYQGSWINKIKSIRGLMKAISKKAL